MQAETFEDDVAPSLGLATASAFEESALSAGEMLETDGALAAADVVCSRNSSGAIV